MTHGCASFVAHLPSYRQAQDVIRQRQLNLLNHGCVMLIRMIREVGEWRTLGLRPVAAQAAMFGRIGYCFAPHGEELNVLALIEAVCWAATIILAILWVREPKGDWEPWAFLVSIIASAVLEMIRRQREANAKHVASPVSGHDLKEQSPSRKILERIHDEPVSRSLSDALRVAKQLGNAALEKWCRLELYGYTAEGGMQESDSVPVYRGVNGRWFDLFGAQLDLSEYPDLSIVNQFRLRFGAKILEELAAESTMRSIVDDNSAHLLRKHTGFNAARFSFSPEEVRGVLDTIKNRLAERLAEVERTQQRERAAHPDR